MHNKIILATKIVISAGVVFTLGSRLEGNTLLLTLYQVNILYLLMSIFFSFLAVPVVGNRWRLLAGMFYFNISTSVATRATFAGLFVGQVLPGGIGADFVRGWMVWNIGLPNQSIIASLVADRIVSLSAVALMIVLSMPLLTPLLPQKIVHLIQFIAVSFTVIASISYFSFRKFRLTKAGKAISWLGRKVGIEGINISMRTIFYALGFAVLGHVLMIFSAYFLSLAIGINSSFWMWLLIMPVIILVTAIPISINGWGVREFAMVYLWGLFGIAESDAFLISICIGLVAIISSLPGLWFWLRKKQQVLINASHIVHSVASEKVTP
jgi:uncharacterized protein (TIRG00374 family)